MGDGTEFKNKQPEGYCDAGSESSLSSARALENEYLNTRQSSSDLRSSRYDGGFNGSANSLLERYGLPSDGSLFGQLFNQSRMSSQQERDPHNPNDSDFSAVEPGKPDQSRGLSKDSQPARSAEKPTSEKVAAGQAAMTAKEYSQLLRDLDSNSFRTREAASEKLSQLTPSQLLDLDATTRTKPDDPKSGAFIHMLTGNNAEARRRAEIIFHHMESEYIGSSTVEDWLDGNRGPGAPPIPLGARDKMNLQEPVPSILASNLTDKERADRVKEMTSLGMIEKAIDNKDMVQKIEAQSKELFLAN
jgi:hypothetical protein